MLGLPPSVRIYFATELADMRKGIDGLRAIVEGALRQDPYAGLSPPATEGPSFNGITGPQGPTRWRAGGGRRRQHRDGPHEARRSKRSGVTGSSPVRRRRDQGRVMRKPFSRTKCSARSVSLSAMTCALSASGKTFGQSLNGRLVVMQVERR